MQLFAILVTLHVLPSMALFLQSPPKTLSLVEQQRGQQVKLNPGLAREQWLQKKHDMRLHMLADEPAEKEDMQGPVVEGCLSCHALQVVYGKYKAVDGDQTDNSYYLFKDATVNETDTDSLLPIVVHFHSGGFWSGAPWQAETSEIKAYLRSGFAVVSVGYRLAAQKYFYEDKEGNENTEELIHVSKDGKLVLDKTGETMEDYKVQVGDQEFITKYLYDATQMMENLVRNAEKYRLDVHRIVFVGESAGGAAIQYLTWVYHQWNVGHYTPRGIVYQNAQLNYPVNNMLSETLDLFSETMGPQVKLADVVSQEACPTIIGNPMCGSEIGNTSDYDLCNEEWNARSLREFCGEALKSATLGQVTARQVWAKKDDEGKGMEKLWYASENMQKHMPSGEDPFYIYVANSMNGTSAVDVAHHSLFALNFAKYAEMGKHGGHQYTVYYTDFAHMSEEDRGTQRLTVLRAPHDLHMSPAAAASSVAPSPSAIVPPGISGLGLAARYPGPAPARAPSPAPAFETAPPVPTVFNYLSTHGWREDVAEAREVEAGTMEERVLYACLAAGIGPFASANNTMNKTEESAAVGSSIGFSLALAAFLALLSNSH